MNALIADQFAELFGPRDVDILTSLERFRLLNSRQIQRLHFTDHDSDLAGARACNRALRRLREIAAITALERRVGGVRKGSASYVWHLAATGERYLRTIRGEGRRRRFVEPGRTFVNHTLAVNDIAVAVLTTSGDGAVRVEDLTTEPQNWRRYLGTAGEVQWLKPDLHLITSTSDPAGDFEDHAFLEIDLGTEHLPRIQAKCRTYAAYYATGAYQAEHGVFPAVVWLSADPARRRALRAAVAATTGLPALFRVTSPERYLGDLLHTGTPAP